MIDALKKMDKKFLITVGGIILVPVVLLIFLAIIQACSNRKVSYEKYESKMIAAAKNYIKKEKIKLNKESEMKKISLNELVDGEYIKPTEKLLDDITCKGSVTVRRNGKIVEENEGGYLNYIPDLKCDKYSTVHLNDKLKESLTTTDSGLYQVGNEYIFRGENPKNYINFYGKSYRIMGIDSDGIVKLIRTESELNPRMWDNKYNTEAGHNYGKNIYKDSKIKEYLLSDYLNIKKIKKDARQHIVAYNACIGKRGNFDNTISRDVDCTEKIDEQVISLINVSDYFMASTDPECKSTDSKSCNNYNYLYTMPLSSWTLNSSSDTSYEAFYVSSELITVQNSNTYSEYNIVLYIDGNELYTTGKGTEQEPYVLEYTNK